MKWKWKAASENEEVRARTTAKWLNVNFFFCYIFYVMLEHAISKASAAQSRQLFWFPLHPPQPFSTTISFQVISYGFCTSLPLHSQGFARCAIVALAPIAKKRKRQKRHALWAGLSSSCSLSLSLSADLAMGAHTYLLQACVCGCVCVSLLCKRPLVCFHLNYKAKTYHLSSLPLLLWQTRERMTHPTASTSTATMKVPSNLAFVFAVFRFVTISFFSFCFCFSCCCCFFFGIFVVVIIYLLNRYKKTKVRGTWEREQQLKLLLLLLFRSYFWNTLRIFFPLFCGTYEFLFCLRTLRRQQQIELRRRRRGSKADAESYFSQSLCSL